jgi:putative acetyltransferase
MEIVPAHSPDHLIAARNLFVRYAEFLGFDLSFQEFQQELDGLPGDYARPDGQTLLAIEDDHAVGCVAMRKLGDGICEMKRLYLLPEHCGNGLGRKLSEAIIEEARDTGYRKMRLDSLASLKEAMGGGWLTFIASCIPRASCTLGGTTECSPSQRTTACGWITSSPRSCWLPAAPAPRSTGRNGRERSPRIMRRSSRGLTTCDPMKRHWMSASDSPKSAHGRCRSIWPLSESWYERNFVFAGLGHRFYRLAAGEWSKVVRGGRW